MKIDKNIPVPKRTNDSVYRKVACAMMIDDSVFYTKRNQAMSLRRAMARYGMLATTRIVEGGFRIWRTK